MSSPGKCSRLPWRIKKELHVRLRDNEPGAEVLAWLNAQPETRAVLEAQFGGREITPQNLSDFKLGKEHQRWLKAQAEAERAAERTRFVLELSQDAGLDLSDTADAITTSKVLELMETAETGEVVALTEVLGKLRKSTVARAALEQREREMRVRERKLELDIRKFEEATVKKFMEFARTPEARDILDSGKPKAVQMELLHQLMFGPKPNGRGEEVGAA